MATRYLILSDLHLTDFEDHADGWKKYKGSQFSIDADFESLLQDFSQQKENGNDLCLILNGDTIDFDLITAIPDEPPWPVSRSERRRGMDASEAKSIWKLEHILGYHTRLISALAQYLAGGHQLVYVMGNHDREFHFAGVQQAWLDALQQAASRKNLSFQPSQVVFEPWFYSVPDKIFVEHGQQYDYYVSFRHLLQPTVKRKGEEQISLPMGNLSNRYLINKLGFFNPHASDYILNVLAYLWHWLRHYAFTRRSIVLRWLWGSLVVLFRMLGLRRRQIRKPRDLDRLLPPVAKRYGLEESTVRALWDLHDPPITGRLFRMIREFWIDRVLIAIFMTGGTIALALVPIPLWIKLMVPLSSFPLLYFIYEWAVAGESVFAIEKKTPVVARKVAQLLSVNLVAFGHTHKPKLLPLGKDVTFVDTGTWAPVTLPGQPDVLAPGLRTYLMADFSVDPPLIQLRSWLEDKSGASSVSSA